jgi:hypothetical protein
MTKRKAKTLFFDFNQNNSGGSFNHEPKRGIGHYVIVEAFDAEDANRRAEAIGLYFGGNGDCSCCGDRWHAQWSDAPGNFKPMIYDQDVSKGVYLERWGGWGLDSYIHYMDGTIKTVKHQQMDEKQIKSDEVRREKEMAKWKQDMKGKQAKLAAPKRKKAKKK